jgi:hypothetical protein
MATENAHNDYTFEAAADLTTHQYKFVELDSAGKVVLCNAAADLPIGVLQNKPNTGEAATVRVSGISKVSADAALATIGTLIGTSADGQADAKIVGTDVTEYVVGRTLTTAANAGEIVSALIDCIAPGRAVTGN